MGCSSVCCEYVSLPLVNKEAALAYDKTEYSQAGRDISKVSGVREMPCSYCRRQMPEIYGMRHGSEPHGDLQINRNGLIEDVRAI